ncbi:MAG TPA: 1-(5-phosphoribosyl)-5-[(5-phosphoribosylamino)methylideneamino]imidazole-4-carboxamide isomerase [Actinomycetota bacterium]|nr:1-(5-phosphoribosyl)-5-[(5-phosphoribosylamino)methylideneamino]imidazole-4-carboxamide isomerase [Actinomycetota bacterium]
MPFEVIPAIDLCEGQVVRVEQGDLATKIVYDDDPVLVAQRWEEMGAVRIHVVDLDGAAQGRPAHLQDVARVITATSIAVQVGGGIRDLDSVRRWIDWGADRVVLGTAALTDRDFLSSALDLFAQRVVVALDARDGHLRVGGWREDSGLDLLSTAAELAGLGVRRLLCTDISRDGMMSGPNLEQLCEVAQVSGVPVIASGGVSGLDDIRALSAAASRGIEGVVVGRALYAGALELREAIAVAAPA